MRSRTEPAEKRLRADVDPDHAEAPLHQGELHVVHPDDPAAGHVDELMVEHVLPQQDLAIAAGERLQIDRGGGQPGNAGDTVQGLEVEGRYEEAAAAVADDES